MCQCKSGFEAIEACRGGVFFRTTLIRFDPSKAIRRSAGVAFLAVERPAEHSVAALWGDHPGAIDPRWFVAHMLIMPAFELGDPVPLVVPMKTDDVLLHIL